MPACCLQDAAMTTVHVFTFKAFILLAGLIPDTMLRTSSLRVRSLLGQTVQMVAEPLKLDADCGLVMSVTASCHPRLNAICLQLQMNWWCPMLHQQSRWQAQHDRHNAEACRPVSGLYSILPLRKHYQHATAVNRGWHMMT